MTTLHAYRITNAHSGVDLGIYADLSPRAALDQMARCAGYADYDEACEVAPVVTGEIKIDEIDLDTLLGGGTCHELGVVWYDEHMDRWYAVNWSSVEVLLRVGDYQSWIDDVDMVGIGETELTATRDAGWIDEPSGEYTDDIRISDLREEAFANGDHETFNLCDMALSGDEGARERCIALSKGEA